LLASWIIRRAISFGLVVGAGVGVASTIVEVGTGVANTGVATGVATGVSAVIDGVGVTAGWEP
jgi:hypothetical protein